MQLLVVHHDAEVGMQLTQMVGDYSSHASDFAPDDNAAMEWALKHRECGLLLVQLTAPGIDGLELGGSLSEAFSGLQTIFLPSYAAMEERLEVPHSKVFPEPIDGERLLKAIDRAAATPYRGLDLFHVIDILQMCCISGRSGAIQMVKGSRTALVFLHEGKIVHAERSAARGPEALAEIVAWETVEFAYDETVRAPAKTIAENWDDALIEAVMRNKRQPAVPGAALREVRGEELARDAEPAPRRRFFGALRKG